MADAHTSRLENDRNHTHALQTNILKINEEQAG
jgi:hypothetical protein